MDNYGNDFITLTDEEGNEIELEHLDTLEHLEDTYMVFGLADPKEEEEETAVVIMKAVEVGDEEMLEEVQDEILAEEIFAIFMERIEEEE